MANGRTKHMPLRKPRWLRENIRRKYAPHVIPKDYSATQHTNLRNLLAYLADEDLKYAPNMRKIFEFVGRPDVVINWPHPSLGAEARKTAGDFSPYQDYFFPPESVSDRFPRMQTADFRKGPDAPVGLIGLYLAGRLANEGGVAPPYFDFNAGTVLHELGHALQFASAQKETYPLPGVDGGKHISGFDRLNERFVREDEEFGRTGKYTTPNTLEWGASHVAGEMLKDLLFREPLGSKESILPLRRTEPSLFDLLPNLRQAIPRVPEPPRPHGNDKSGRP